MIYREKRRIAAVSGPASPSLDSVHSSLAAALSDE